MDQQAHNKIAYLTQLIIYVYTPVIIIKYSGCCEGVI